MLNINFKTFFSPHTVRKERNCGRSKRALDYLPGNEFKFNRLILIVCRVRSRSAEAAVEERRTC